MKEAVLDLTELVSLLPIIIIGGAALIAMLSAAWRRCHVVAWAISMLAIALACVAILITTPEGRRVTDLFWVDGYASFASLLILFATAVVAILFLEYCRSFREHSEEFFIALLMSCAGALTMCISNHFISFFLGLELLTVPIYAMIAYVDERTKGLEAAIKYIILAGASAAFLLFGMALVYAQLGSMRFDIIAERLMPMWSSGPFVLLMGFALIIVGVGFKLSVFPFHMWTPDVYEGAPAPVTAYLATVSKGAMMVLFLRFFVQVGGEAIAEWHWLLSAIAIASMFVGNWLALFQTKVKRILAYSSIAHVGYMMVALLSGGSLATEAVLIYLATYFAALLLALGALTLFDVDGTNENVEDFRGFFYVRPWLSGALILAFFSLVGIPLSAGFMGKYWILASGVSAGRWSLVICLILSSILGLYAYLRVVLALFQSHQPLSFVPSKPIPIAPVAMVILALLTLLLGIFPNAVLYVMPAIMMGG